MITLELIWNIGVYILIMTYIVFTPACILIYLQYLQTNKRFILLKDIAVACFWVSLMGYSVIIIASFVISFVYDWRLI